MTILGVFKIPFFPDVPFLLNSENRQVFNIEITLKLIVKPLVFGVLPIYLMNSTQLETATLNRAGVALPQKSLIRQNI
jgi:hypothetical protein